MTAEAAGYPTARRLAAATWRLSRSRWVWTPAAVTTAGVATATLALGRLLTAPPATLRQRPPPWSLQLEADGEHHVRLSGPAADVPGHWGLEWPSGYGTVGPPAPGALCDEAPRPLELLSGTLPDGTVRARLTAAVWPGRSAFTAATGIAGSDLVVHGETGELPAWVFPAGDGRRWCLLVHGRGAPRAQMLRLVPALHARGVTAMVISYRNDSATCSDPTGRMHFGHREWRDLEAAVAVAQARGARELVLAGMSLGGGIIATFLRRSDRAGSCVAAILDAPALNWGPILRHVARARRVPGWLVPGVMATAAVQARIDWSALNHVGAAARPTTPVLLVHGDRDPVIPVELSDAYAAAEPDLVTYLRVEGAGHVCAWNTAREAYEQALGRFLDRLPARQAQPTLQAPAGRGATQAP